MSVARALRIRMRELLWKIQNKSSKGLASEPGAAD
jgi:hypothetical protein